MSNTVQLRLTRKRAFVGCAMGIKVFYGGTYIDTISNGKTSVVSIPAKPDYLKFEMVSTAVTTDPISSEVFLDPSACYHGGIDCTFTVKANWQTMLIPFGWLYGPAGHIVTDLKYL